ncbi:MAG: hypothetical protein QG608_3598 [Actinomycetota bacterium]|nr:hypothetical protein [Actinomycetota bacterium]
MGALFPSGRPTAPGAVPPDLRNTTTVNGAE